MDNDPAIGAIVLTGSEKVAYLCVTQHTQLCHIKFESSVFLLSFSFSVLFTRHLQLGQTSRKCSTGTLPPTTGRTSSSGGATSPSSGEPSMIGTVGQNEILWLEILESLLLLLSMDMHLVVAVRWVAFLFHQGFRMLYPIAHCFSVLGITLEGRGVYRGPGWWEEKQKKQRVPRGMNQHLHLRFMLLHLFLKLKYANSLHFSK